MPEDNQTTPTSEKLKEMNIMEKYKLIKLVRSNLLTLWPLDILSYVEEESL